MPTRPRLVDSLLLLFWSLLAAYQVWRWRLLGGWVEQRLPTPDHWYTERCKLLSYVACTGLPTARGNVATMMYGTVEVDGYSAPQWRHQHARYLVCRESRRHYGAQVPSPT